MLTYVLITPARNEAKFIELTLKSVVSQTIHPLKWVIVSDGSTDGTDQIVKKYVSDHPWIELIRMPERKERHFAGKVYAFNAGWAKVSDLPYQIIGNLDGDVSFDEEYYEFLLAKFVENSRLGVAGTPFMEGSVQYDYRFTDIAHVSGQCQLFRRECFEEIGGYIPRKIGGVDLVAVISARMKDWETRSFLDKTFVHHRQMNTATHHAWLVPFRGGRGDYILGSHPVWEFSRCLYQMTRRPIFVAGILRLAGFTWALLTRAEKGVPCELVHFRRTEQMHRLHIVFKGLLTFRYSGSRAMFTGIVMPAWKQTLTRYVQRLFWIYQHHNFVIRDTNDFKSIEASIKCTFVPITLDNYFQVRDFREQARVPEYRKKLASGEIGFFAECNGKMAGSIWATINRTRLRSVARMHIPLLPNEALIHDIVTAGSLRGMGLGPFMVGRMASNLLDKYRVNRIMIDVSCRNRPSLRMMEKVGLHSQERVFSVSLCSKLAFQRTLKPLSAHPS